MAPLVTTYLEMQSHLEMRKAKGETLNKNFAIRELTQPDWKFNREMYFKVGENWKWTDKRPWTDEQWKEYATDPNLRTFAGHMGDEVAGYFELLRSSIACHPSHVTRRNDEIEIAYFGLLSLFIGRGLGGALLTSAIENAWSWSPRPSRVWVHTCNRDHPGALTNYQARGFKIYKIVED
jgi:GNAT superfamily N-acetyltransferase